MWALLSRRFRMYLVFALGAPIAAWAAERAGRVLEARQGPSGASRALQGAGGWLNDRSRGPVARRRRAAERAQGRDRR